MRSAPGARSSRRWYLLIPCVLLGAAVLAGRGSGRPQAPAPFRPTGGDAAGREPAPTLSGPVEGARPVAPAVRPGAETAVQTEGESRIVVEAEPWRASLRPVAFVTRERQGDAAQTLREEMQEPRVIMRLPAEWFDAGAQADVRVGLAGDGLRKQVRSYTVVRGGLLHARFPLEEGMALAGRVVSEKGEPVAGLRLVARRTAAAAGVKSAAAYASDDLLYSAAGFEEARGRTDALGRFRIAGLGDHPYVLTTADLEWGVLPVTRSGVRPPQEGLELVVARTVRIHLEVRDARSGEAVPHARVRLSLGDSRTGFACREGSADVALVPDGPVERRIIAGRGAEVPAHVQAFGYRGLRTTLVWAAGSRVCEHAVVLEPVALYEARLQIRAADGSPATGRFRIVLRGPDGTHSLLLEPGQQPGEFRQRVPGGRWTVRVHPQDALSQRVSWESEVQLDGDLRAPLEVRLPAFGQLQVLGWEQEGFLLAVHMAGGRIHTAVTPTSHTYFLLEGEWPYVASIGGRVIQEGIVAIRAGEQQVLRVTRE